MCWRLQSRVQVAVAWLGPVLARVERGRAKRWQFCGRAALEDDDVSHYHTPTNGAHGPHSHSGLFSAAWYHSIFLSSLWQGSHFRMMFFLPFAFTSSSSSSSSSNPIILSSRVWPRSIDHKRACNKTHQPMAMRPSSLPPAPSLPAPHATRVAHCTPYLFASHASSASPNSMRRRSERTGPHASTPAGRDAPPHSWRAAVGIAMLGMAKSTAFALMSEILGM